MRGLHDARGGTHALPIQGRRGKDVPDRADVTVA